MLLLPEGKYRYEQKYVYVDEVVAIHGIAVVLNARPDSRSADGVKGAKLEMLVKEDSTVEVEKNEHSE